MKQLSAHLIKFGENVEYMDHLIGRIVEALDTARLTRLHVDGAVAEMDAAFRGRPRLRAAHLEALALGRSASDSARI